MQRICINYVYLANVVFSEKYVSCGEISMDETLVAEVVHATSDITGKAQQHLRSKLARTIIIPTMCVCSGE